MPEVLTPDDSIEKLSGRDLSVAVAEKVMNLVPCDGWRRMNFGSAGGPALIKECAHGDKECYPTAKYGSVHGSYDGVPPYAEKIAAAMEVVEKMWRSGWSIEMANCGKIGTIASDRTVIWYVRFIEDENDMNNWSAEAETLPVAICRAALKAVGAE